MPIDFDDQICDCKNKQYSKIPYKTRGSEIPIKIRDSKIPYNIRDSANKHSNS